MTDKPEWKVLPCPACKSTVFCGRYDQRARVMQIVCSGCAKPIAEMAMEER